MDILKSDINEDKLITKITDFTNRKILSWKKEPKHLGNIYGTYWKELKLELYQYKNTGYDPSTGFTGMKHPKLDIKSKHGYYISLENLQITNLFSKIEQYFLSIENQEYNLKKEKSLLEIKESFNLW